MNRRAFVTGLGAVLAAPVAVCAEQVGKVPKVGFPGNPPFNHAFEQGGAGRGLAPESCLVTATSWRGWRVRSTTWSCGATTAGAQFFLSGFEHSLTADAGEAWARSPWEAVQRAAADARRAREAREPPAPDWTT